MNTFNKLRALPQVVLVLAMATVVWCLQGERRRIHRLEQAAGMKVSRVERGAFGETVYYAPGKPPSSDVPMQWSDVWGWVADVWRDLDTPSTTKQAEQD